MKVNPKKPPRRFEAGVAKKVAMFDCGTVELKPEEQVTFITRAGGEYDVVRKAWGFYATPSTNGRLVGFGLRAALVKNTIGRWYVVIVEKNTQDLFEAYRQAEGLQIMAWLDDEASLAKLTKI